MKNLLKITFGLFFLSILFMGCTKKADNSTKNYIKYDNKEYDLSSGGIFSGDFGTKQAHLTGTVQGYPISLLLISSGFTLHEIGGIVDSISGTGSGIVFEAFSASQDKLDEGQYVFDSLSLENPGTFQYSDAVFDYNSATEVGTEVEMNAGTFSVKKSGNDYEITFDCKTYDGKTVTGYYKGSIKSYIVINKALKNKAYKVPGWNFIP